MKKDIKMLLKFLITFIFCFALIYINFSGDYYGKTKSTSITIKKLSKNKSYKIKVRAYKTFQGKQYFGENSNVLKVTILKNRIKL